ncbi:hypothetical protein KR100_01355 [Synechococcus sp. KORDI-100]|nr:hypothetical protein KR100_01355 [Synechococcus sp. KORDI-100]
MRFEESQRNIKRLIQLTSEGKTLRRLLAQLEHHAIGPNARGPQSNVHEAKVSFHCYIPLEPASFARAAQKYLQTNWAEMVAKNPVAAIPYYWLLQNLEDALLHFLA